ncbi:hypothetical protein NQ317_005243, partial [Molorchus minor]
SQARHQEAEIRYKRPKMNPFRHRSSRPERTSSKRASKLSGIPVIVQSVEANQLEKPSDHRSRVLSKLVARLNLWPTLYSLRQTQKINRRQPGKIPAKKMAGGPSRDNEPPSSLEMLQEQLSDARQQNQKLLETIEELKQMMEITKMRADAAAVQAHTPPADPPAEKFAAARNSAPAEKSADFIPTKTRSQRRKNAKRTKRDNPTSSSDSEMETEDNQPAPDSQTAGLATQTPTPAPPPKVRVPPIILRTKDHWTWLARTLKEKKSNYTGQANHGRHQDPPSHDHGLPRNYEDSERRQGPIPHVLPAGGQTTTCGNPWTTRGPPGNGDHGRSSRSGIRPVQGPKDAKPGHENQDATGACEAPGKSGKYPNRTETLLYAYSSSRETTSLPGHRTVPPLPAFRACTREVHGSPEMCEVRRRSPFLGLQEALHDPREVRQLRGASSCQLQGAPEVPQEASSEAPSSQAHYAATQTSPKGLPSQANGDSIPQPHQHQLRPGRKRKAADQPAQASPAQTSPPVPHQSDDPDGRDDGQDAGDVRDDGSTVREAPRNELLELADRLEPDVIAIQETKMDSRHELKMRGYKVYRQDRNIRGGGVAVLVKSNITHHQTRAGGLGNLEAIGVEIQLPRREPLHILSCYQPPNAPLLGEDLGDLFPDAQQVIAIGDFNAKSRQWNSRRLNARGRELEGFLDAHPEIRPIAPPEPTQQTANNIPDVLDIALAGNIPYDLSIANHREGSSDHDPILLTVWGTHTDITIHTRKITDWGAFRAHLQTLIHDITLIHNTEELDLAVLNLETDIKTYLVHSTTERQEPRREKCLGQISEEAMDLIRARRAAKRRAWRTRDPADRRVYNQYTRLVREELDSLRQERWNSYLSELDPADPGLWKTQKILRTARRPIPPIHGERGLVYTKQDKAEAFADSLEMQCRENPIDEDLEEWERTRMHCPDPEPWKQEYRKGAVLSPHLFAIYTSDVPKTPRTSIALYADDTAILARSRRARTAIQYLQEAVDQLEGWCDRWKISINAEKSKSVLFRRCYSETPGNDHVTYGGENVPWTDSVKYLGVTMDRSLTWRMHIESTVAQGKACFHKLYPMIGRHSQLDLRNKLLLIRQVIQSQLTYAATAWGYAASSYQKRLQSVENIALRCAVNAPRFVRNADIIRDLQYTTTTDTIKERATKLYAKIDAHHNPLVRAASDYDPGGPHRHRRPRMQLNRQSLSYRGLKIPDNIVHPTPPTLQRGYAPEQSQTDIKS